MSEPAHDVPPRIVRWTRVFVANCLVPSFLGVMIFEHRGGFVGMFLGMLFLWLISLFLVNYSEFIYRSLILGGTNLAFTQIIPIPQMLAGTVALQLWYKIHSRPPGLYGLSEDPIMSEVGGFVVTILVGQPLLAFALIIGAINLAISRSCTGASHVSEHTD
ncbi:hypothetical protein BH11PLA2_BH11PLA2_46130 [soil metagenome]